MWALIFHHRLMMSATRQARVPPGIPVATVGVNGAQNAAILAAEMMALGDEVIAKKVADYKATLGAKIEKANKDLAEIKYPHKVN